MNSHSHFITYLNSKQYHHVEIIAALRRQEELEKSMHVGIDKRSKRPAGLRASPGLAASLRSFRS
jgi:hypothetical protein